MKSVLQFKVPAKLHIYARSGHGFGLRANDPKAGVLKEDAPPYRAQSKEIR